MTDDEFAGKVPGPVDGKGPAPDEELVPSRGRQFEDDLLPPSQDRHHSG